MAGLLTHTFAAIICLSVIHLMHFKWEYSWSVFVGNYIPDIIKFGFSGIKQGTLILYNIKHDSFFQLLSNFSSNSANWFTVGFFILGTTILLYHFHYIKKKTMEEYDELYVFFLIGIIVHLILDIFIIETSPWW